MTTAVFWDFHGTLTYDRYGWSGTMLRILDEHRPGHGVRRETLSRLLCTGFPWHAPEEGHTRYNDDPEGWWRASDRQMERVYNEAGIGAGDAARCARLFRETYVNCTENFIPYDDAVDALSVCRDMGYRNVILSNHVPELSDIISRLPFAHLIDSVISSARVGYEKPHPAIFARARQAAGMPDICWMAGDNYKADCLGGLAAGFRPIWVHPGGQRPKQPDPAIQCAETLAEAVGIILGECSEEQRANG